jgi:hypothetical protein
MENSVLKADHWTLRLGLHPQVLQQHLVRAGPGAAFIGHLALLQDVHAMRHV